MNRSGKTTKRRARDVKNLRCDTCRRKYVRENDFHRDHIDFMCLHWCNVCELYFPTKNRIKNHKCKLHCQRSRTAYECYICHQTFAQRTPLRYHYGIHTADYRYRCIRSNCHALFDDHDAYRYHLQTMHDPSKKYRFECYACRIRVRSRKQLARHSKVHEPKEQCQFCQRFFKRAVNNHECKFFVEELQKIAVLGYDQKPYKYKLQVRTKPIRDRFWFVEERSDDRINFSGEKLYTVKQN